VHFWALEIARDDTGGEPTPIEYLQRAYEHTLEATTKPTEWQGTTTATGAQLYFETTPPKEGESEGVPRPVLYVTNLGDSQVLVLRPRDSKVMYKTEAQWHWFDCPRQLGTNSPDTPRGSAVMDRVLVEENDVVLAMSDGVTDNLWEHEIVSNVVKSIKEWEAVPAKGGGSVEERQHGEGGMKFVAERLMNAARVIAQDPFAESPFMEHAIEEGLAMEGGECIRGVPWECCG
jgi:protein phosphatase PTC7